MLGMERGSLLLAESETRTWLAPTLVAPGWRRQPSVVCVADRNRTYSKNVLSLVVQFCTWDNYTWRVPFSC